MKLCKKAMSFKIIKITLIMQIKYTDASIVEHG